MEGKDLVPPPIELDTVKGQQGPIKLPKKTYHTTLNYKPTEYNKPPVLLPGYDNKGKLTTENETGKIVNVKTPEATIK